MNKDEIKEMIDKYPYFFSTFYYTLDNPDNEVISRHRITFTFANFLISENTYIHNVQKLFPIFPS